MTAGSALIWLTALSGVIVLARLRGRRGVYMLVGCLLVVLLCVIVWNLVFSVRHAS